MFKLPCFLVVGGVQGVFKLLLFGLGKALHLLPAAVDHAAIAVGQHVLHGINFQHATFEQVGAVHIGRVHKRISGQHSDDIGFIGHAVHMCSFHFFTQVLGIRHHAHAGCSHGVQVGIQAQLGASRRIEVGQCPAQAMPHAVHCGGLETQVLLPDEFIKLLNIAFECGAKAFVNGMASGARGRNGVDVGTSISPSGCATGGDDDFAGATTIELGHEAEAAGDGGGEAGGGGDGLESLNIHKRQRIC